MCAAGSAGLLLAPGASATNNPVATNLALLGPVTAPCWTPNSVVHANANGKIDFTADLTGLNVAALGSAWAVDVAVGNGPNVTHQYIGAATSTKTPAGLPYVEFTVPAGSTQFTYTTGTALGGGTGLLGTVGNLITGITKILPPGLASGAAINWRGTLVGDGGSNDCSIQPQLPGVNVSAGPVKVSVPGVQLPTVPVLKGSPPVVLPSVSPPANPIASPIANPAATASKSGVNYTDPGAQVPDAVVPKGGGNGLYGQGSTSGGSGSSSGGGANGRNAAANASNAAVKSGDAAFKSGDASGPMDVASRKSSSAQAPIVLAILATLALALVSSAYARSLIFRSPGSGTGVGA